MKLQDSSRLSNFIVSGFNHRFVDVLGIAFPSSVSENNFSTFGIGAVLSLFILFTLRTLTRIAPVRFHHERKAMEQQSG